MRTHFKNTEKIFWSRIKKIPDGCWEWQGRKKTRGYGQISFKKKQWAAHRLAWTLLRGPVPEGLFVCHRCDNPPCCNPDHLWLGTRRQNVDDMLSKGRQATAKTHGAYFGMAKLTVVQVKEIRAIEGKSNFEISKKYGVDRRAIWAIRNFKSWLHV